MDEFFSKIPRDTRYHIDLRTEAYLAEPVFEVLKKHGVGLVFSHWTRLPLLRKQFAKVKVEVRMSYEESYAKAFPFDKMASGMLDPEVIEDTVKMVNKVMKDKIQVNLIINNRASGKAPLIAQRIADRLHSEKQQRLLSIPFYPHKQGFDAMEPPNWCDEYFLKGIFDMARQKV